jgi:RNA polymerase sigma-70 factor (ECF subfamily)
MGNDRDGGAATARRRGRFGATGRDESSWVADRSSHAGPGAEFDELLVAARRGSEDAFAAIWRSCNAGLVRYLRVIAGGAGEDLAADTWLQVARKLHTFEGDEGAFRAWLYTIGRNRHIDWRRQQGRRCESLVAFETLDRQASSDDDPGAAMETKLSTADALALVATLPPDQAEAVMLRTVVGLPVATVAEIMDRPAGTVRVLCHRGLRRLAGALEAQEPATEPARAQNAAV